MIYWSHKTQALRAYANQPLLATCGNTKPAKYVQLRNSEVGLTEECCGTVPAQTATSMHWLTTAIEAESNGQLNRWAHFGIFMEVCCSKHSDRMSIEVS